MSEYNENNIQKDIENNNTETSEINIQPKPQNSFVASLLEYVEIMVFSIIAVILIFTFFFRLCTVSGSSMENTLEDGEHLLVSNLFYTPKSEDIIVFHQTGGILNEPVVKRVIAVGGEKVDIDFETWTVTVTDKDGNQRVLDETYIKLDPEKFAPPSYLDYPVEVPEGKLFVMGDNRNASTDSRYSEIGFVDQRRILGKVILRITPFEKFGAVD